jgi:pimeloyl-ACP methyl ester carboxylesterase
MQLADGRTLAWAEYGDANGTPAFYFHGTPGGRLEGLWLDDAARDQHVRLFAIDRPGYGYSTFHPNRKLRDFPTDVTQLADHLGLDRFAVIGTSGGGPHAQACATAIPERLTSATVISGAGSPEATLDGRKGLRNLFARYALFIAPLIGWFVAMWTAFWAPHAQPWMMPRTIDRNVLPRPGVKERFLAETRDALRQGGRAMAQDLKLFSRKWGFGPKDIRGVPVILWHGDADRIVPATIGRYYTREIEGCQAKFFPGEEHLMFVDHAREIFGAVANAARVPQQLTR